MSALARQERPTQYLVTGTRAGQVVRFERHDAASAFATARQLRWMGWTVTVEDPFAEPATSVRRLRVATGSR